MVGVIIGSKRTGINPDNIAAPIAASFGDLITLGLLAIISQKLFSCMGEKKKIRNVFHFIPGTFYFTQME